MASRSAARAFHLDQDAHIDQIIEIALAEQQSPAERAGEQLGGRFPDKRSLAGAGLQHAENNETFDRLPDGGASDPKPDRELFLAGDQIAWFPNSLHNEISQSFDNLLRERGSV